MSKTNRTIERAVIAATASLALLLSACSGQVTPGQSQVTPSPSQVTPSQSQEKEPDTSPAQKVDESLAPDRVSTIPVLVPPAAASALEKIQKNIASYVEKGTKYTFTNYVDPTTGKIVLDTDAPADVVATLTKLSNATAEENKAISLAEIRPATTTNTWNRRDDIQPYYGGAGIMGNSGVCSSGYAVQTLARVRYMVTAGHCFADGETVLTESGLNTYGTVSKRRVPNVTGGAMDIALIGGRLYSRRVYVGPVDTMTSQQVVAAGAATVGFANYCRSGRTTGEQCGHTVVSITGQACSTTGCIFPAILYTGGTMAQGGDSGGAFYSRDSNGKLWIRGHHVGRVVNALTGAQTGFAEPWTEVVRLLGVSIVTVNPQ